MLGKFRPKQCKIPPFTHKIAKIHSVGNNQHGEKKNLPSTLSSYNLATGLLVFIHMRWQRSSHSVDISILTTFGLKFKKDVLLGPSKLCYIHLDSRIFCSKTFSLHVYVYVCLVKCTCMNAGACRVQKRALDPLQSELQEVDLSHITWLLGTELGSFTKPTQALHWASILPAPCSLVLKNIN